MYYFRSSHLKNGGSREIIRTDAGGDDLTENTGFRQIKTLVLPPPSKIKQIFEEIIQARSKLCQRSFQKMTTNVFQNKRCLILSLHRVGSEVAK